MVWDTLSCITSSTYALSNNPYGRRICDSVCSAAYSEPNALKHKSRNHSVHWAILAYISYFRARQNSSLGCRLASYCMAGIPVGSSFNTWYICLGPHDPGALLDLLYNPRPRCRLLWPLVRHAVALMKPIEKIQPCTHGAALSIFIGRLGSILPSRRPLYLRNHGVILKMAQSTLSDRTDVPFVPFAIW